MDIDYQYFDQLLQIIRGAGKYEFLGPGITTFPTFADASNKLLHAASCELERSGLIYRKIDEPTEVLWMPL